MTFSHFSRFCHSWFVLLELSTQTQIIIIVVVCLAVVVVLVAVIVIKMVRGRRMRKQDPSAGLTQPENMDSMGRADPYNRILPAGIAPPPYGSYAHYTAASHDMTDRCVLVLWYYLPAIS